MSEYRTVRCAQGADLIWKQCNEALFNDGLLKLETAAREGDSEAWYFLGHCYSFGDGGAGYNARKAYDCYRKGVRGGSALAAAGAYAAGLYDESMAKISPRTLSENYHLIREMAEAPDPYAAWQLASLIEEEKAGELLADKPAPAKNPEEPSEKPSEKSSEKPSGEPSGASPAEPSGEAPEPSAAAEAEVVSEDPVPVPEESFRWYEIAAKGGIVRAMEKVGECLKTGTYTEKSTSRYLDYAAKAASLVRAWGLLETGLHVREERPEDAFLYMDASARQGSLEAEYHLGMMYLRGEGCERNVREGEACLREAAARGHAGSALELGNLFYQDILVEREDDQAYFWYSRAYEAGEKDAVLPLARLCMGETENRSLHRAEALLLEADETDETGEAALALGNLYRDGLLGAPDPESAIEWYRRGAAKENAECMELLGSLYFQGEDGIETDYDRAFIWLSRCYEKGTLQQKSRLAYLYLKGFGCEADEEKAIRLFQEASEYEYDGFALYELGYIYETRDTKDALDMAADYYRKAAAMGNENAVKRLQHFKKNIFGRWRVIP